MKKIIAVGMVVGLLCLSSCASSPEETTTVAITTNQTTETPTEATTQETEPVVPETLPMPDDPVLFEKGTINWHTNPTRSWKIVTGMRRWSFILNIRTAERSR